MYIQRNITEEKNGKIYNFIDLKLGKDVNPVE
jgi:hypothetical protein